MKAQHKTTTIIVFSPDGKKLFEKVETNTSGEFLHVSGFEYYLVNRGSITIQFDKFSMEFHNVPFLIQRNYEEK